MLSKSNEPVKSLRPKFPGQIKNSQSTYSQFSARLSRLDLVVIESALISRLGAKRLELFDYCVQRQTTHQDARVEKLQREIQENARTLAAVGQVRRSMN